MTITNQYNYVIPTFEFVDLNFINNDSLVLIDNVSVQNGSTTSTTTTATNDMYTVMTWSSQSGTFSTTNVTGLPAGLDMDVTYDAAGLILTVVEGPSGINSFTSIVADEQPAGSAQGPGDTREEQKSVTGVVLHWEADAGQSFNLEMTHDMTEWISIPAVIEEITPGHYRTVVELPAEPQQCFFRFVRSP